jgi:N-acetylmuramic acid 6-phosphate etherase
MAGGDAALVRAVEGFEDHPEYGEKQLLEGRFRDGDLLVAASEGGETPFVIGAVERAAEISGNRPWFLYCNPDAALIRAAERSARVIADPRVEKLMLPTGPMALSGSTRMQASTVLMAAVGYALLEHGRPGRLRRRLESLVRYWRDLDTGFLAPFTLAESGLYAGGGSLDYVADPDLAITVLTDTAERSPTFAFPPFQSSREGRARTSPCHLLLPDAPDAASAWWLILGRAPRGLDWPALAGRASLEAALGFDFSRRGTEGEVSTTHEEGRRHFFLSREGEDLVLRLDSARHRLPLPDLDPLGIHLVLKMLLNAHSTLVMGRLGRYDGNVMTWVRPTNNKLVDRAVRYADRLLRRRGISVPYGDLVRACFALRDSLPPDRPLVPELARHFSALRRKRPAHPERRSHAGPLHA